MTLLTLLKRLPLLIALLLIMGLCAISLLTTLELSDSVAGGELSPPDDGITPPDIGDTDVPDPIYDDLYCSRVGEWYSDNPFTGWPTDNVTYHNSGFITTYFCDPNYGFSWEHEGLDFAWPLGTNVIATADAEIVQAGVHYALGNMVLLCSNGYCVRYGHLDSIAPAILGGGVVSKGQVIGQVGSSGLSTGVHLHYDMYDATGFLDPFPTLNR